MQTYGFDLNYGTHLPADRPGADEYGEYLAAWCDEYVRLDPADVRRTGDLDDISCDRCREVFIDNYLAYGLD